MSWETSVGENLRHINRAVGNLLEDVKQLIADVKGLRKENDSLREKIEDLEDVVAERPLRSAKKWRHN